MGAEGRDNCSTSPSHPVSPAGSSSWAAGWGKEEMISSTRAHICLVRRLVAILGPGWLRIQKCWFPSCEYLGCSFGGFFYLRNLLPPLHFGRRMSCPLSPLSAGLLSLVVTWPPQAPFWGGAPLQVIQSGFLLQRPSLPHRISAVLSSPVWKCKLFTHQPPPFPVRHQTLDSPTTLFFNSRDWNKLSEWFTWRPLIPAMYSEMAQGKVLYYIGNFSVHLKLFQNLKRIVYIHV